MTTIVTGLLHEYMYNKFILDILYDFFPKQMKK